MSQKVRKSTTKHRPPLQHKKPRRHVVQADLGPEVDAMLVELVKRTQERLAASNPAVAVTKSDVVRYALQRLWFEFSTADAQQAT